MGQIEPFLKLGCTRSMLLSRDIEAAKPSSMFAPMQVTVDICRRSAGLDHTRRFSGDLHLAGSHRREDAHKGRCLSRAFTQTPLFGLLVCARLEDGSRGMPLVQCPAHSLSQCMPVPTFILGMLSRNQYASIHSWEGTRTGVALTKVRARRRCLSITMNSTCCVARSTPRCSGFLSPA
jgi:hypothetical protein